MKKISLCFVLVLLLVILTACGSQKVKEESDALKFKEEYEALNGKVNASGKMYRNISIPENNPFVYIETNDLINLINNGETFYVYFGSPLCPWCRSAIEKAIDVALEKGIEKIYYVDIWDNDGNEILRDKYVFNEELKLEKSIAGTDDYYKLLDMFSNVLKDYTLTDKNDKTISVGEKRIYAPNFILVKNGLATKLISGTSSKQKDSREELTEDLLNDEEEIFKGFFESLN